VVSIENLTAIGSYRTASSTPVAVAFESDGVEPEELFRGSVYQTAQQRFSNIPERDGALDPPVHGIRSARLFAEATPRRSTERQQRTTPRRAERSAPNRRLVARRGHLRTGGPGRGCAGLMRKLGEVLRVEAMSLCNHVANKTALLDGMVDVVFSEIGLAPDGADWKSAMRQRAVSARPVQSRPRWALGRMV
jgi:hypothetical protein